MKKLVLLLTVVGFSFTHAQSKGKITYRFSILKDSIKQVDSLKTVSDAHMNAYKMLMDAKPIECYLVFNGNKSLYYVEPRQSIPTWNHSAGSLHIERGAIDIAKIFAGGTKTFYRDLEYDFLISQMDFHGKLFRLIKPAPTDWVLKDSTKVILGYTCKYAESKISKLKVWYTEDIPVGHGPQNFSNLPGMVLEAYRARLDKFTATSIELNHYEADEIIEPVEGKLITVDELREMAGNPFGKKE